MAGPSDLLLASDLGSPGCPSVADTIAWEVGSGHERVLIPANSGARRSEMRTGGARVADGSGQLLIWIWEHSMAAIPQSVEQTGQCQRSNALLP